MSAQVRPQTTQPAQTSHGKNSTTYFLGYGYVDPKNLSSRSEYLRWTRERDWNEIRTYTVGEGQLAEVATWLDPQRIIFSHHARSSGSEDYARSLAARLCQQHPVISTYSGIFGGIPHLKGLRISVADILEQLYLAGSIEAVTKIYSPDVSEDDIKEAIAYAQDFIESALSSPFEIDG